MEPTIELIHAQATGDTLVLYTDGVTEAANPAGEEFGIARLQEAAARRRCEPPAALVDACLMDVDVHRGTAPVQDDITLMAVRRHG